MMKKLFQKLEILVIICFIFTLTGCKNSNVNRGIRHSGFAITGEEFTCDQFIPRKDEFDNYEKIWIFGPNKIITKNGVVYERSTDRPFSNEKYCKISNFTNRAVAILDNSIIKGNDNRYYYLQPTDTYQAFTPVGTNDNNYNLYQILLGESDTIKVITVNQSTGVYYVLKKDGNIYKYTITNNNNNYTLRSKEITYSKGNYGGNIIDFNYTSELKTNFIRTETKLYRELATNYEDCSKYADIVCKYNLVEDYELEQYLDRIIAYDGQTIITDYGAIFVLQ